ncbi:serine/threonine-protein kinase [Streptomyces sp. MNP-20]|uniref:serine/threonine-protein kinase n=1 Tax=Streptomyces sp. MNP-20 TaxID=2721165 RepID=UPI0015576866|nr:serine/threonine-protein kinase [Streptomyces sp. MNP-20]
MQGLLLAGRYRLGESIGSGGMGRVWRARDEVLHRAVAVKELTAAQWVQEADRAVLLTRTQTEARAQAQINHSAVVTVHDVLEYDDRPWIVMELVEGCSLADAVKERGRVEAREVARIGLWVLRALRAAHTAGVLHRDIKPGNVLLSDDGRVLLTDFGIAAIEGDKTITRTGEVVGSVDYLAPERVSGANPGPAADLWALGATLYTAVEGNSPFRRTSPLGTMQAVVTEEPAAAAHAGALGPVIAALLRKDPTARPSADEAEQMLAEAAEGRRPSTAQAYVPTRTNQLPPPVARPVAQPATAQQTAPATPTPPAAPGRGRWARRLALVAAAALLGGGAVFGYLQFGGDNGDRARAEASEGTESKGGKDGKDGRDGDRIVGGIPADWERVRDAEGFSLMLPKGWSRRVDGNQIDYTPDNGRHFVRIAIDRSPDFDSPYAHQIDLERQLKLPNYQRLHLNSNNFRDHPGALWEFRWTAGSSDTTKGPRHAIEQGYINGDGVEYMIYMSGPEASWDTTREQFDAVLRGWRD